MKRLTVAILAATLGMGVSAKAQAHDYRSGGSILWADESLVIGFNYGGPYVRPYYVPPRYVYRPRSDYRRAYYKGRHHGKAHGYNKGYHKGYRHGHHKGHRDDRRHDRRHGHHDRRRH